MQEYKVTIGEYAPGAIRYYKPGTDELHRLDGPAVECADGYKTWYIDGKRHRTDGPAVDWAGGYKAWYAEDLRHRLDGPAVEYENGSVDYWIEGKKYSKEQFLAKTASAKEMTVAELEKVLGHKLKIIK